VRLGERLAVGVRATALEPHLRGRAFTIVSEARAGEELVWTDESTILRREKTDGGDTREREPPPEPPPARAERLPGDLGRRYPAVSGDRNPIHMHDVPAKLLGFPRTIAHGMWTKARCLAGLENRLPAAYAVEARFRKPVLLPSSVTFGAAGEDGGAIRFAVRAARDGAPHVDGGSASVEPGLGDREDDVPARDRDEVVRRARPVAADDLDDDVGERDEVALGGVEEIRQAAAVAVGREGEAARDAVAGGLDVDAFVTVLHAECIGTCGGEVEPARRKSNGRRNERPVVLVAEQLARLGRREPAQLVDLVVGDDVARLAVDVHAEPAHELVAALAVDVVRRLELGDDAPANSGLLLDLAQRTGLEALSAVELALRQRPVVVAGAVDHRDPPVGADDEPARGVDLRVGHGVRHGIGSAAMGRVIHFEIHADDPDRAQRFYTEVFGWNAQSYGGPMDYRLLTTGPDGDLGINGAILRRQGPAPEAAVPVSGYVCTIQVDSIEETERAVPAAGGEQVLERMEVPDVGQLAYFRDTEGNVFGALEPV
jgi:predicted enzyme related to lactoylglutathione lyase